jgi:hypothetical protein
MQITARGWGRDMGTNVIGDIPVSEMRLSKDQNQYLHWNSHALFSTGPYVEVHWTRDIRMTGSYRMEIHFTRADIVRLLTATMGTELDVDLIDQYGFTVSPELTRAILSKVKLTDITVGDLVKMTDGASKTEPAAEEKPIRLEQPLSLAEKRALRKQTLGDGTNPPPEGKPFLRRV